MLLVQLPDAGAGQHGDGKLRHHRHVERDPVADRQAAKVAQQRRNLVHPPIELLVGNVLYRLIFELWNQMYCSFIPIPIKMSVNAIVGGINLAADEPSPERRVARIERFLPVFVLGQEIGALLKALGKIVDAKALMDLRIG
jgi:hypothetical protein